MSPCSGSIALRQLKPIHKKTIKFCFNFWYIKFRTYFYYCAKQILIQEIVLFHTQAAFTKARARYVKMFIVNNKDTSVFIVNFDQVNANWVTIYTMQPHNKSKKNLNIHQGFENAIKSFTK